MPRNNSLENGFSKLGMTIGMLPRLKQDQADAQMKAQAQLDAMGSRTDLNDASTALKGQELDRVMSIARYLEDPKNGLSPQVSGLYNQFRNNPQQAAAADLGFQKKGNIADIVGGDVAPGQIENALSVVGAAPQVDASGQHRYTDAVTPGRQNLDAAKIGALSALTGQRDAAAAKSRTGGAGGGPKRNPDIADAVLLYNTLYPMDRKRKTRANLGSPGQPVPDINDFAREYSLKIGQKSLSNDLLINLLGLSRGEPSNYVEAPGAGADTSMDPGMDPGAADEGATDQAGPADETDAGPPAEYPDAQFDPDRGIWIVERGGKKFAVQ